MGSCIFYRLHRFDNYCSTNKYTLENQCTPDRNKRIDRISVRVGKHTNDIPDRIVLYPHHADRNIRERPHRFGASHINAGRSRRYKRIHLGVRIDTPDFVLF